MSDDPVAALAASVEPASRELGERARAILDGVGAEAGSGAVADMVALAARLAAATHTLQVPLERRYVIICAADHGVDSDTGRPPAERAEMTWGAVLEVARGDAAVCALARSAEAQLVLVDCGVAVAGDRPPGVLELAIGPGTGDICRGPAMSRAAAEAAVNTGVAVLLSLAQEGCDCIALGQLATTSHGVTSALIARLLDMAPDELVDDDKARDIATRALAANPLPGADPLALLAGLGGYELGVLCGVVLAAASLRIPVVLDDRGTSAAALLAARVAPACADYLFASHAGTSAVHRRALEALGLTPLFDTAISQGEGAGAAAGLALVASAAALLRDRASAG